MIATGAAAILPDSISRLSQPCGGLSKDSGWGSRTPLRLWIDVHKRRNSPNCQGTSHNFNYPFAPSDPLRQREVRVFMRVYRKKIPIRPPLESEQGAFGPDTIAVLAIAFEDTLRQLRLADRNDPAVTMVAKRIIELARQGERDPIRLRDQAIHSFR
jgi:hypothetical protein